MLALRGHHCQPAAQAGQSGEPQADCIRSSSGGRVHPPQCVGEPALIANAGQQGWPGSEETPRAEHSAAGLVAALFAGRGKAGRRPPCRFLVVEEIWAVHGSKHVFPGCWFWGSSFRISPRLSESQPIPLPLSLSKVFSSCFLASLSYLKAPESLRQQTRLSCTTNFLFAISANLWSLKEVELLYSLHHKGCAQSSLVRAMQPAATRKPLAELQGTWHSAQIDQPERAQCKPLGG